MSTAHTAPFKKIVELLWVQDKEEELAKALQKIAILVDDRLILRR